MSDDTSRLRQQLLQVGQEQQRQLDLVLRERGPLVRGHFGTRGRVCGNAGCHCARGELHESKYLSASDGGVTRQVHVPAADEVMVSLGTAKYRAFQSARARLIEIAKQQLELVDRLGRSLLAQYPPGNPLPPPKRRGRPPKSGPRKEE